MLYKGRSSAQKMYYRVPRGLVDSDSFELACSLADNHALLLSYYKLLLQVATTSSHSSDTTTSSSSSSSSRVYYFRVTAITS